MTHEVQRPPTAVNRVVTPGSLDEALNWMAEPDSRPIAGGTDLMVELDRGQHQGPVTLIDLTRIPGLDRIESSEGTITLGPLVTHNQVVASDLLRRAAVPLVQACWEVGSPQLRNRATVAGNIVTASPANDTLSPLVALEAEVTVASTRGQRRIPLSRFHLGVRRTELADDELLTGISFPALTPAHRGLYLKLGLRRAQAISVVHVAVVVRLAGDADDGPVEEARLALGSVAPTIVRAAEAEAMLIGRPLDAATVADVARSAAAGVEPIDDLRAPAAYRSAMVAEMVGRALVSVRDRSGLVPEAPPLLWGTSSGHPPVGPEFAAAHDLDTAVTATVNGRETVGPGAGTSLLEWLRDRGCTGVKEGCAEGECGSCTVDLDGMAVLSCLVPASRANRATIVTIEGLASTRSPRSDLHPLQEAFIRTGAVQCGFCIPGFLMSGAKLLDEHPEPTEAQIKSGLSGNLCRCTGYYKIEDAVRVALGPVGPGPGSGSEVGS